MLSNAGLVLDRPVGERIPPSRVDDEQEHEQEHEQEREQKQKQEEKGERRTRGRESATIRRSCNSPLRHPHAGDG